MPVGVFRTWVKYIEKGAFPHTRRHFGVLRCNQCENAPCIVICPTRSLYRRPDGIVDFDSRRCIGCKSCMQACPYDALYIDPNPLTAAKCNFCAHRIEARLAPACAIVCPTQAIIAGDLDDPSSRISRMVAEEKVSVRKPQKGTGPKLFYVGIEGDLLEPTRLERENGYFWAERRDGSAEALPEVQTSAGAADFDSQASREVYDVAHPSAWGWKIGAYLWTKSIAAGALLVAAMLRGWSGGASSPLTEIASPLLALVGVGLTGALLIFDLKRPQRFFYLLTKPNPRSWLVIGAWILMAYGGLASAWLFVGFLGSAIPAALVWASAALGAAVACYSAFLFAQAKGRDLWQSPLFFWHLLAHAFIAGSAALSMIGIAIGAARAILHSAAIILLIAVSVSLAMILLETALPAVSQDAALAHRVLTRGRLSRRFWILAVGVGSIIPIVLAALALAFSPALAVIAAVLALAGLWSLQQLWIEAGQAVPLS